MKHHFVAFVRNKKGQLIELDGTKVGPNVVQEGSTDVLKDTAKELMKRVANKEITESLAVLTLSATQ